MERRQHGGNRYRVIKRRAGGQYGAGGSGVGEWATAAKESGAAKTVNASRGGAHSTYQREKRL